jgi:AcrR family transcriptional regulator
MMPRDELRARLVKGAGDIFYRDGIAATGTAGLARELGISKRTMYELFASKDELVAASLRARDEPIRARLIAAAEQAGGEPREQLIGLFAGVEALIADDGFRGCPFVNATSELADPDHPAHAVCRGHKDELRRWMERTARRGRLRSPRALSDQLLMLLDGALVGAATRPPRRGGLEAAARTLIEAATPGPATASGRAGRIVQA